MLAASISLLFKSRSPEPNAPALASGNSQPAERAAASMSSQLSSIA